jgi:hypothetical protein
VFQRVSRREASIEKTASCGNFTDVQRGSIRVGFGLACGLGRHALHNYFVFLGGIFKCHSDRGWRGYDGKRARGGEVVDRYFQRQFSGRLHADEKNSLGIGD